MLFNVQSDPTWFKFYKTRMHSSKMHLLGGIYPGASVQGESAQGVSTLGGVCPEVSAQEGSLADPPCEQNDRQV